jgi:sialate O-acetylesterase
MYRLFCFVVSACLLCGLLPLRADLQVASVFTDHMVLQRDMPLPVWGTAAPGAPVAVAVASQSVATTADANGRWRVDLAPIAAGGPFQLVVNSGAVAQTLADVWIGEVWLCAGQSNMRWRLDRSADGDLELLEAANHPRIRWLRVTSPASTSPLDTITDRWQVSGARGTNEFSAIGYLFGKRLLSNLDVAIGLIDISWGGSAAEAWVARPLLEENPLFAAYLADWDQRRDAFAADPAAYRKRYNRSEAPLESQHYPANLYHGRLSPVMPFAIRGVIWYQGENNASRAAAHYELFPLLIASWRDAWGQGDFPFYWVQLASYRKRAQAPEPNSDWAALRASQTATLDRLPLTGQALAIDVGEADDIHPVDKHSVADRLARIALAQTYGLPIPFASPRALEAIPSDTGVAIRFSDTLGGLRTRDRKSVAGFAVADAAGRWDWAAASITDKDTITVSHPDIEPVSVSYGWANNPDVNLYNSAYLPVVPFMMPVPR